MSAITNLFGEDGFFWWVGVVEDRNDPLKVGRCRVRILGYHIDNKETLPTTDLPWAIPMQPITSAAISGKGSSPVGPLEGTWVIGFFVDGKNKQQPMIMGTIGGLPSATSEACAKQEQSAAENQPGTVKDSSGNTVKDGSGNPVQAGQNNEAPPPANQKQNDNVDLIVAACKANGLTDLRYLAAVVGNVFKECQCKSQSENLVAYGNTPNERIRMVFGSRANKYTDEQLNAIKKNPQQFGDLVYGPDTQIGQGMGNTAPGDGYKYRGRGFIQLTGKANYTAASKAIFGDDRLVTNPDQANTPEVAAKVVGWYMKKGYSRMAGSLSINTSNMSQADANLLATSQIAGSDIRRKGAIGVEILNKVNKYASAWVPGTPGGDRIAGTKGTPAQSPQASANTNQPNPQTTAPTETMNDPATGNPKPFADPNSVYPKCEYQDRPDTNKLATGDTSGTLISAKAEKRTGTAEKANGKGSFREPDSAYCAQYPYNHVIESESGHTIEMDDTPKRERIHLYHRAGTFVEIDPQGTWHQHVEGDHYGIYVRNNHVYIKGAYDITVEHGHNVLVKGAYNLEVQGATVVNLKNDATINVGGKADISVAETAKIKANGIFLDSLGDINMKAAGNVNITAGGGFSVGAGGSVDMTGSGFNYDGGDFNANSGSASPTDAAESGLGAPAEKMSGSDASFDDLERVGCDADTEKQSANDGGENPNPQEGQTDEQKQAGEAKVAQGCIKSDTNPPKIIPAVAYKRGEFANYKEHPYTIQLSKYYKLGDLANVGSESAAKNRAFWGNPRETEWAGLTKSQLLDNMRGLAVNVLDPIKERFPGVAFTSLLRFDVPAGGSGKSQHMTASACDMQINGVKGAYEAALWIRDNVAYDQLLLEYWNRPGGGLTAWIHCSFNANGNRPAGGAKVGTFMDHKVATGPDGKPKWFLCDLSQ